MHTRRLLTLALLGFGSAAWAASPPAVTHTAPLETWPGSWTTEQGCSDDAQPGTDWLRDLIAATWDQGSFHVDRACDTSAESGHDDHRALDWTAPPAAVQELVDWLTAPDAQGETAANARRLGVMYVIWDNQMWRVYDKSGEAPAGTWTEYGACYSRPAPGDDTSCHRDHVHLSLTAAGAAGTVSYWADSSTESPAQLASSDPEFTRRVLTVEEQTNASKEQVYRAKATLQHLQELLLQGGTSGARAVLLHRNELGRAYSLESVSYYLDGQSVFGKTDPTGELDAVQELDLWDGAVPPGVHHLTVTAVIRGNGFGLFRYVDGYTFKVQSAYAFSIEEGQVATLRVVLDEPPGIGKSFADGPRVYYEIQTSDLGANEAR
jgi:hypothetical protein